MEKTELLGGGFFAEELFYNKLQKALISNRHQEAQYENKTCRCPGQKTDNLAF